MRKLLLCCVPFLSACVSFRYERHATFEPLNSEAIGELDIGTSGIGDALALLGAPVYVWEGVGDSIVLAYGFEHSRERGFTISIPVFDRSSASFSYDDVSSKLEGIVLVFGPDEKLEIVRAGMLRDLGLIVRRRPASPE
ncbi:MAG: hypothetical protein JNL28_17615 [Planctomycetes bacterium]|nr:hypothetical protein [Planctomycetota bacterium]